VRLVSKFRWTDVGKLLARIQEVGKRLMEAQPKEMVVGNIVRRVLGMIKDEIKEERHEDYSDAGSATPQRADGGGSRSVTELVDHASILSPLRQTSIIEEDNASKDSQSTHEVHSRPPLITSHTTYALVNGVSVQQSMFNLLSTTTPSSPITTPPRSDSPTGRAPPHPDALHNKMTGAMDLKAEIINGIEEIIDELVQSDSQIAATALEHIHSNEVILTHTSSRTVQSFLLEAARKRKFTVIIAESYPNEHEHTHSTVVGGVKKEGQEDGEMSSEAFHKPLTAAGITVILITDAAVFAMMSRVNKVILATHAVIANGGLVAAAGARIIAKAAHKHRTPVIVVSGIYKLSPEYPLELGGLIEYGDTGKIITYEDGDLVDKLDVDNPLYDYVPPELVDLYITNLYVYLIVRF
jgi:translation initiation factor eIF-2B subunit beta